MRVRGVCSCGKETGAVVPAPVAAPLWPSIPPARVRFRLPNTLYAPFHDAALCAVQKPVTFVRQVLSLCQWPELLDQPQAAQTFPPDVLQSIQARDGHPCNPKDLWMTDGASPGVHWDCILCPIPQYPLYQAVIKLYGGTVLPYYLDEEVGWRASVDDLRAAVEAARRQGKQVRALVVINPGNPTGEVLELEDQRQLVHLCKQASAPPLAQGVMQGAFCVVKGEKAAPHPILASDAYCTSGAHPLCG
ncbi:hypothetical protein ABPG77_008920, partial [Micractinium sp. CCAP 211/92]